jgi:hypothetical protein
MTLHEVRIAEEGGARREIQQHVEDLRIAPAPEAGDRAVRIAGRAKIDGLLGPEEAVRLQLVAGACNHRFQRYPSFEVDLILDALRGPATTSGKRGAAGGSHHHLGNRTPQGGAPAPPHRNPASPRRGRIGSGREGRHRAYAARHRRRR